MFNKKKVQLTSKCSNDAKSIVMRSICPKCQNKGWYFVDEWFGNLQGRKDCRCQGKYFA